MNVYNKSLRYLKRKLKNSTLTREEWDLFAHENYLFSSMTLIDKKQVANFEELKKKVAKEKDEYFLYNQDIYNQMKREQKKLDENIEKSGLQDKQTVEISNRVDSLTNEFYDSLEEREYPKESMIYERYTVSYYMLKELVLSEKQFPSVERWNRYAKQFVLLNSESMKYISLLEWHYLEIKINRELNMKSYSRDIRYKSSNWESLPDIYKNVENGEM